MKYFLIILFAVLVGFSAKAQPGNYSFYQLYQLDSIGKTSSIGSYFGELYFHFLQLVEKKLGTADTATQRMVRNFEKVFAQFFIDACVAYRDHRQISLQAWRAYFTDTTLGAAQYKLLGTNAHLNGGLSEAIAGSYTPNEWAQVKQKYFLFNSCLNQTYQLVYHEAVTTNKRAKLLDILTLGFDKAVGKFYLYKWRKRQMRLTELYFYNSPKYQKSLAKINRKKDRLDKAICVLL